MARATGSVLVIGSGPNAPESRNWDAAQFDAIVVINNAWQVRPDWTHLIHPEDFPVDRRPERLGPAQQVVTYRDFVPAQNAFGGFVYAGGTMAFTAGYWALATLRPRVLAFIGCDMTYAATGPTHFYGTGAADPLRPDVTLQSLEAKSARLALLAARRGCHCVNLSRSASRLLFPRAGVSELNRAGDRGLEPDSAAMTAAEDQERGLNYFVASGRYWEAAAGFDARELARLDQMWLAAYQRSAFPPVPAVQAG
ncbi:hypothetical protein [Pseudoruegeria sp. SK021]|uniref:hypothetical protein n=1 Tax=Pseudoruegeria sp. SK021 TaxID=1933035 RepID=UPI000A25D5C3|nr:hypothetical protein [Pseudoruegeria sp. SK021]OSP54540.1 hypothetical protein BV911_11775 [Pseudoruegeria sp. SK021]